MLDFKINYDTQKRGLPTLFKYQYFTIDAAERKTWDYNKLDDYMGNYKLWVDNGIMLKFQANPMVLDVLRDLNESDSEFIISRNKADRYKDEKQYIKCRISKYVLKAMKKLFISTLVYDCENQQLPVPESISFSFDPEKKEVKISDLEIYEPLNNPYYKYARNAVDSLSVEAIGLDRYSVEEEKAIKDFYDRTQMSSWKKKEKLVDESEVANRPGVYMLYDENNNTFYVGKAVQIKERILQHANNANGNDPIPCFTHYRYSVISPEYYEFLYLIENSAIHDFAWFLDMPKAKKYCPSLAKIMKMDTCKMVNTAEHQTRKQ
jgi:hypothetical protein